MFVFSPEAESWVEIYRVDQLGGGVIDVEGYDKSSEPLYVALSRGVARTRDAGISWVMSKPRGYDPESDGFGALAVSPARREEAIVATKHRAWQTQDFGETWSALPLPADVGELGGAAFTRTEPPALVIWDATRLYWSAANGTSWHYATQSPGVIQAATVSADSVDAIVAGESVFHLRFATDDPEMGAEFSSSVTGPVLSMAADPINDRAIWIAMGTGIDYCVLKDNRLESVAHVPGLFTRLAQHPREAGTVYAAAGARVERISGGLVSGSEIEPEPEPALIRRETAAVDGRLPESEIVLTNSDDAILRSVMSSQPPVRAAVAAALEYADYDADEVKTWRRNSRRRNALPELSLRAGTREYPTDVFETANAGTPLVDDIHLSDDLSDLDYAEVEVRWDLSDLLFDADEPVVSEEARERAADRNALIREIASLYYERTELMIRMIRGMSTMDADAHLKSTIELHRMTELLNELCGDALFEAKLP